MKKEKTKASLGRVLPLVLCLCLVLSMPAGQGHEGLCRRSRQGCG